MNAWRFLRNGVPAGATSLFRSVPAVPPCVDEGVSFRATRSFPHRNKAASVLGFTMLALFSFAGPVAGDSPQVAACDSPCVAPVYIPGAAPVPFGPGEIATYDLDVGFLGGGKGMISVVGVESMHGMPTYHVRMELEARVALFYHLEDSYDSWIDVEKLFARRFEQEQDETGYDRHRVLDFFPDDMKWRKVDPNARAQIIDTGELASALPLDDISFVFYARTLPLEVGASYSFDRYWKDTGNPVVINVLRRDTIKVPAGEFATIVVEPIIQSSGMFGKGGKAEIHFSDDEYRRVVYMKVDIPVLSALTMKLRTFTPGARVVSVPPSGPTTGSGRRSPPP